MHIYLHKYTYVTGFGKSSHVCTQTELFILLLQLICIYTQYPVILTASTAEYKLACFSRVLFFVDNIKFTTAKMVEVSKLVVVPDIAATAS